MYSIRDHNILVIGGRTIQLPCSICGSRKGRPAIVELNGLVVVCILGWDDKENEELDRAKVDMTRNIWAFDQEGNKVWEIEAAREFRNEANCYTGLWIEDGKLVGYNWVGINVIINPKDGSVFVPFGQRPW